MYDGYVISCTEDIDRQGDVDRATVRAGCDDCHVFGSNGTCERYGGSNHTAVRVNRKLS